MRKCIFYSDVKKMVKSRGGILLSTEKEYINSNSKIVIKCTECDCTWKAVCKAVKRGGWCPKCANNETAKLNRKYSQKMVEEILGAKKGKLLSEYINVNRYIKVLCAVCDHEWETRFSKVLTGNWCAKCNGNYKYTTEEVKDFIKNRNGKLLSGIYINKDSKLSILCKLCNNIWHPCFSSIKKGSWCPICSKATTKSQNNLCNIIKETFPDKKININFNKFWWLYNKRSGGRQEIDIFVENIKLAIEYDGQQHHYPVQFFGISKKEALERFYRQKQLDALKNKKIKQHPEDIKYFIRFNYKEKLTKEYVVEKLKKYGVPI